jgi:hypothetical protein
MELFEFFHRLDNAQRQEMQHQREMEKDLRSSVTNISRGQKDGPTAWPLGIIDSFAEPVGARSC